MRDIDGPGIRLARSFFAQVVAPVLDGTKIRYDAGLIGSGSEVLGFDTERSQDHDFGPRCQIFVEDDAPEIQRLIDRALPTEFAGHRTRFSRGVEPPITENQPGQVVVTTIPLWCASHLGTVSNEPIDWLGIPWHILATTTGGAVFHRGLGALDAMRDRFRWYPDDLWRFVLAAQWQRIAQEESFVGRTGEVGDDLGSAILTGRLIRDLMHLALLLRRCYPPYAKWLGSAFARLPEAKTTMFAEALRSVEWRRREELLCMGYARLAVLQNDLDLCAPVDPACRPFFSRPFQVLDAGRCVESLRDAVTDPVIRALPLLGCVDQFADGTDVLSEIDRTRAVTQALYHRS